MAIILKNKLFNETSIDSKTIIGVLGKNYFEFLKSLEGNGVYYLNKSRIIKRNNINSDFLEYRKLLKVDSYINKKTKDLSHSQKRLLQYFLMIESNSKIMVINEPYLDLDSDEVKIIKRILNKLVKDGKTIIIGSMDINIIYSLCKKVLIIRDNELIYDSVQCLNDIKLLNKYNLDIPNIVEFVELAKKKNINLPYSKDIRDLIKDVYRNVSKK